MRQMLFKGIEIYTHRWIRGGLHVRDGKAYITGLSKRGEFAGWELEPETVCQYTGLTDKNGEEIWENDIVKGLFLYSEPINATVIFKDGAFGLKWYHGDVEKFSPFTSICNAEYEVLGNVFDNPELLKGE